MNIFTLRFQDKKIEQTFIDEYYVETLYPQSLVIILGYVMTSILNLSFSIVDGNDSKEVAIWVYALIALILSIGFLQRNKHRCQLVLTLLFIQITVYATLKIPNTNKSQAINDSFSYTALNASILFVSELKHSFLQNIIFIILCIVVNIINQSDDFSSLKILTFFIVCITMLISSYWNNKQSRVKFLLSQKENMWIDLMQYVCENPFQILTFDDVQLKYKIIKHNSILDQDFIKESQIDNKSLQTYIHNTQKGLIIQNGMLSDNIHIVQYKQSNLKLRVTYYNMQKVFIFVQIIQDENKLDKLKALNSQTDNMVKQMIHQLIKLLPNATRSSQNLLKLKLALLEIYLRRFQLEMKVFSLNNLVQKHIKSINKTSQKIQFKFSQMIKVNGYKNLYSLLFLRILYSKSKISLISISSDDDGQHITFYGKIDIEQDQIIQKCIQVMKIEIVIAREYLKLTQVDILFNNELNIVHLDSNLYI
ncbi:hypothetical protein pb186bvf_016904 [Paramecium bursaria]